MENYYKISLFCKAHNIDKNIILEFQSLGIIQYKEIKKDLYIDIDDMEVLEKLIRIKKQFNLNIDAIGIINDLMTNIENLNKKLHRYEEKIKIYEGS